MMCFHHSQKSTRDDCRVDWLRTLLVSIPIVDKSQKMLAAFFVQRQRGTSCHQDLSEVSFQKQKSHETPPKKNTSHNCTMWYNIKCFSSVPHICSISTSSKFGCHTSWDNTSTQIPRIAWSMLAPVLCVCVEKRRAKTNGIHPCLIKDNEGEGVCLLQRETERRRNVNHMDTCLHRCCLYLILYLDHLHIPSWFKRRQLYSTDTFISVPYFIPHLRWDHRCVSASLTPLLIGQPVKINCQKLLFFTYLLAPSSHSPSSTVPQRAVYHQVITLYALPLLSSASSWQSPSPRCVRRKIKH